MAIFPLLIVSLWTLYNCAPYRFPHLVEWKSHSTPGKWRSPLSPPIQFCLLCQKGSLLRGMPSGDLFINSCLHFALFAVYPTPNLNSLYDYFILLDTDSPSAKDSLLMLLCRKPARRYFSLSVRLLTVINQLCHTAQPCHLFTCAGKLCCIRFLKCSVTSSQAALAAPIHVHSGEFSASVPHLQEWQNSLLA